LPLISSAGWTNNGTTYASFFLSDNCTNGFVLVQNDWEGIGTTGSDAMLTLHGDSSVSQATNVICAYNTMTGPKQNIAYDDLGSTRHNTEQWLMLNNNWSGRFRKSDTFSGNTLDGNRIGNWPMVWGVGCYGDQNLSNGGGAVGWPIGSFFNEFAGLVSYQPAQSRIDSTATRRDESGRVPALHQRSQLQRSGHGSGRR
jgi:hypothetical protein